MKLNGKQHTFIVNKYSDMNGQKKDLIIPKESVGIWTKNKLLAQRDTGEHYYEVVISRKIISAILEAAIPSPEPIRWLGRLLANG
jgi:hypothetical protein